MVRKNRNKNLQQLPTINIVGKSSRTTEATAAATTTTNISKKSKIRYLLVRGENYEKQTADLLQSISLYARRNAKLRDAGDIVAEKLNSISSAEILNPSLKRTVFELSKIFRLIQDHRDSEILYLEDKLLPLISEYGETLQKQREDLRSNTNKMLDSNRRLNWIRLSSSSSSSNTTTMNNQPTEMLAKRRSQSMERLDSNKHSIDRTEKFIQKSIQHYEMKKNIIFKKLLLKFLLTELRFTMKSFNNLTYIYKHILDGMNPSNDLKYFNEFFRFNMSKKITRSNINIDHDDMDTDEENTEDDDDNDDDYDDDDNDDDDDDDLGNDQNNESDGDLDGNFAVQTNQQTLKNKSKSHSDDEDDDDGGGDGEDNGNDDKRLVQTANQLTKRQSGKKKSVLKRFNSTPEISTTIKQKDFGINKTNVKKTNDNKKIHLFGRSMNNRLQHSQSETKDEKTMKKKNKVKSNNNFKGDDDNDDDDDGSEITDENDDDDDDDDSDDDSDESNSNSKNNKLIRDWKKKW